MLVAVHGFGSIWTRRFGKNVESVARYTRDAAFYNTTGVPVGNNVRARSRVYGVGRFSGSSGFTPHRPERMLNRVFKCAEPCWRINGTQVLFEELMSEAVMPDYYLVIVRHSDTGWIDREATWKARECVLVSFSESDVAQEAMLLMPAFSWVLGGHGALVLEPDPMKPGRARLRGAGG